MVWLEFLTTLTLKINHYTWRIRFKIIIILRRLNRLSIEINPVENIIYLDTTGRVCPSVTVKSTYSLFLSLLSHNSESLRFDSIADLFHSSSGIPLRLLSTCVASRNIMLQIFKVRNQYFVFMLKKQHCKNKIIICEICFFVFVSQFGN